MLNDLINRLAVRSRILRLPPIDARRREASARRRMQFRPRTDLPGGATAALAAVETRGVYAGAVAGLLPADGAAAVARLAEEGGAAWDWRGSTLLESDEILEQRRDVYALGLHASLLDFAEHYLGEPILYMGCSLKYEAVDAFRGGTRQWHLDIEDDRMLRIILYLNAVAPGGGPFQYIDAARSQAARSALGYRSGYIGDDAMRMVVDEAAWHSVTGAAGTMLAFDGTRVFHRVAAPTSHPRLSLSFTYTSRHPRFVFRQVRLRSATMRSLLSDLAERERGCLPAARWT